MERFWEKIRSSEGLNYEFRDLDWDQLHSYEKQFIVSIYTAAVHTFIDGNIEFTDGDIEDMIVTYSDRIKIE